VEDGGLKLRGDLSTYNKRIRKMGQRIPLLSRVLTKTERPRGSGGKKKRNFPMPQVTVNKRKTGTKKTLNSGCMPKKERRKKNAGGGGTNAIQGWVLLGMTMGEE